MSVWVGRETRLLVQGLTGREGMSFSGGGMLVFGSGSFTGDTGRSASFLADIAPPVVTEVLRLAWATGGRRRGDLREQRELVKYLKSL